MLLYQLNMSAMIVSPSEFVPSQHMLFTKPKVNASGGKSIGVLNSKTRRSVLLNTPLMLTWGVNVFDNPNGKSYNLALQFPRKEFSNKETDDFLDMLKEMEKHVLDDGDPYENLSKTPCHLFILICCNLLGSLFSKLH